MITAQTGLRRNDLCLTALRLKVILQPPDNPDRCADGSNSADECEGGASAEDVCYTGEGTQDICLESGGHEDGDLCQGGGATTNGQEQDTCMDDGTGDECNPETTIGDTMLVGKHQRPPKTNALFLMMILAIMAQMLARVTMAETIGVIQQFSQATPAMALTEQMQLIYVRKDSSTQMMFVMVLRQIIV